MLSPRDHYTTRRE